MGTPKGDGSSSGPYEQIKPGSNPPASPSRQIIRGIDVSHWQEGLDWDAIKKDQVQFCIAEATTAGMGIDALYFQHLKEARARGIPVTGYHFMRFDIDPLLQAEKFISTLAVGGGFDFAPCLDIEWDNLSHDLGYHDGEHGGTRSTMDDRAADSAIKLLERLEASLGIIPMIYTSYSFFKGFNNPERFAKYPLWVPAYHTTLDKVRIPAPWKKLNMWQYADNLQYGRDKKVDGNYFFGSLEELKALGRK